MQLTITTPPPPPRVIHHITNNTCEKISAATTIVELSWQRNNFDPLCYALFPVFTLSPREMSPRMHEHRAFSDVEAWNFYRQKKATKLAVKGRAIFSSGLKDIMKKVGFLCSKYADEFSLACDVRIECQPVVPIS
jgi:hypothetical protein